MTSTTPGAGQSHYVISQKRKSFTLYEVDRVTDDVSDLKEQVRQLQLELTSAKVGIVELSDGRRLSPSDVGFRLAMDCSLNLPWLWF